MPSMALLIRFYFSGGYPYRTLWPSFCRALFTQTSLEVGMRTRGRERTRGTHRQMPKRGQRSESAERTATAATSHRDRASGRDQPHSLKESGPSAPRRSDAAVERRGVARHIDGGVNRRTSVRATQALHHMRRHAHKACTGHPEVCGGSNRMHTPRPSQPSHEEAARLVLRARPPWCATPPARQP